MTQPPVSTPSASAHDAGPAETAPPPAPGKTSVWEDFIDIFYAPSPVFARRENGSVWIPLLVVTLLIGILFLLNSGMMESVMDAEFRRTMAAAARDNPQLNAEAMQGARGFAMTMAKIMAFIAVPIAIFLVGLMLWAAGKVVGARQTFHAALVVAAYSYVPKVIEAFLMSVQGLLMDTATLDGRYRLTLGIGRFVDPDTASPLLLALVGRLDVFTIWVTVLLAIGLAVTGKIPKSQAAIAAALVWLAGAVPGVVGALRS